MFPTRGLGPAQRPRGVINFYTTELLCTMVQRTMDVGKIKLVCQNVCRKIKRFMLLNSRQSTRAVTRNSVLATDKYA